MSSTEREEPVVPAHIESGRRSWVRLARPALVVSGLVLVAGAFLPWVASGDARRDSFEVVQAGRRLGVFDSGVTRLAGALWFLVPLAVAVMWLTIALRWRRFPALVGTIAGLSGVLMAVVVFASSLDAMIGPGVTLGGGAATVVASILHWQHKEHAT